MRVLFLTHSVIGDRSYGGPMRGNGLREALLASAEVDTVVVHSGEQVSLPQEWDERRSRTATVTATGLAREALAQQRALRNWVAAIIATGRYDAIVAQYVELARLVPRRERARLLYDPDDFLKSAPPGSRPWSPSALKLAVRNHLARRMARQAGHVWYVNPAAEQLPRTPRRSFLPNVVPGPDPGRARGHPVPGRVLMVGHMLHAPNVEGLAWFHTEVLPGLRSEHPALELHVVGRYEPGLPGRFTDVVFHGWVDDVTPHYDRASLVVAPIRSGGGTQIKVIDALAHGRPLVASHFAWAGFADDLEPDRDLLVAQSASEWCAKCALALGDPAAAAVLAQRGEEAARRSFGPERMSAEVGRTLSAVVGRS